MAGRGTDLLTTKTVEDNGGLHVILTYMPPNVIIEEQAFGRTARKGNKGTAKIIVQYKEENVTIDILRKARNENERARLEDIRTKTLPSIEMEDKLFKKFMDLLLAIKTKF